MTARSSQQNRTAGASCRAKVTTWSQAGVEQVEQNAGSGTHKKIATSLCMLLSELTREQKLQKTAVAPDICHT